MACGMCGRHMESESGNIHHLGFPRILNLKNTITNGIRGSTLLFVLSSLLEGKQKVNLCHTDHRSVPAYGAQITAQQTLARGSSFFCASLESPAQ